MGNRKDDRSSAERVPAVLKLCTVCGPSEGLKPSADFQQYWDSRRGRLCLTARCKKCIVKARRAYRKTPKGKAYMKRYNSSDKAKKAQQRYRERPVAKKKSTRDHISVKCHRCGEYYDTYLKDSAERVCPSCAFEASQPVVY